jgi:hypothetical protein
MAERVYIETTVVSYFTARPNRDVVIAGHQQVTHEWWDTRRASYELCVSQLVLDEAGAGDATRDRDRLQNQGIQGPYHLYARGTAGVQAMNDPIVDEVRRVRDAHAARFNYDLDAIFQDIKEREKKSGLQFVQGVARQPVPNQALQPTGAAISVSPDSPSPEAAPGG